MIPVKKIVIGAAIAGSTLTGGAIGAALVNGSASAQTSSSTTAPAATTAPVDHSNNDAAHEAGESAQREADETAGKLGRGGDHGGDHVSNKDPAHEAAESPERAAEEASRDAAIANGTTSTTTP